MKKSEQIVLQRIKNFCLLDDEFMTKCFTDNIEATELVLRIILNKPDIEVKKVLAQKIIKHIKGHSLTLDIYATDTAGKKYNIEIQRADKGAGARRARYHSSLIDSDILPAGVDVELIAETYVIFITENDVLNGSKPIYHIERYIQETKEYFNDGAHIIYVNAAYIDDTNLGKLMHDFSTANPNDMNYEILANTTRYYKDNKEGIRSMSRIVEELILDEKKEAAIRFLERGKQSVEEIAEDLDLPLEVVEALAEKLQFV